MPLKYKYENVTAIAKKISTAATKSRKIQIQKTRKSGTPCYYG